MCFSFSILNTQKFVGEVGLLQFYDRVIKDAIKLCCGCNHDFLIFFGTREILFTRKGLYIKCHRTYLNSQPLSPQHLNLSWWTTRPFKVNPVWLLSWSWITVWFKQAFFNPPYRLLVRLGKIVWFVTLGWCKRVRIEKKKRRLTQACAKTGWP